MSPRRTRHSPHPRRPIALIEAPTNLGLKPPAEGREPGVRRMPDALRALGLHEALGAESVERVEAPPYRPEREPPTGVRNARAIAAYSADLAHAVEAALDGGCFPLVVGGDCSVLLGSALALRRRGRYGLVYVDGHEDFLTPARSPSGGAAGMDLALAAGCGPDELAALDGLRPLVHPEDIVVAGFRDEGEPYDHPDVEPARAAVTRYGLAALRDAGMAAAAEHIAGRVARPELAGAWLHLDVDVLDDAIMPAVDSPQPDGLTPAELETLVAPLLDSGAIVGAEVTIYDPDLDPTGAAGRRLVGVLERLFAHRR